MVYLYSPPDPVLFKASSATYYSVSLLPEDESVQVINVKSILSVISMQPRYHLLEPEETPWFVCWKMGLEMGLLTGAEQHFDDDEADEEEGDYDIPG